MPDTIIKEEEIIKLANFLGLGFYKVTIEGKFIDCNPIARKIFGMPQTESDLSNYSIKNYYVVPDERDERLKKMMVNRLKPLCGTLSLKINKKNFLFFDLCWFNGSNKDKETINGLIGRIEDSSLFPTMFDTFPMGLYETDEENRIVRVNKKFVEILNTDSEKYLLGHSMNKFCNSLETLEIFNKKIAEYGSASDILKMKGKDNKVIEVEFFTQKINEFKKASWGVANDVTTRERFYGALERLPTGFYHIENNLVTDCNEHFARILGFEKKEDAIGINTTEFFAEKKDVEKYLQDLKNIDKKKGALQNYEIKIKKANSGDTITISVDSHVVRDSRGKDIGREGTIRDISKEVELRERVIETDQRLKRITTDINKLIHTFLHPVIKFSGNSEQLFQVGRALWASMKLSEIQQPVLKEMENIQNTGEQLLNKLIKMRDALQNVTINQKKLNLEIPQKGIMQNNLLNLMDLKMNLNQIINIFDYSLNEATSDILLRGAILGTSLWTLEELNKYKGFDSYAKSIKPVNIELLSYLQFILFNHLTQGASILVSETKTMKRMVEALRSYIGMRKKRRFIFAKNDIGKIIEEVLELFRPVLSEVNIEIDYKKSGNLTAEISANDIDRIICNLLQNVRKYSAPGKGRFVKVRAKELNARKQVEFSIESFGVPIKKEEIEKGLIWQFGYRGDLAYESDRDGTGVGLADVQDVVFEHQGEIDIFSTPVTNDGNPPQYKVPYLTKIIIKIPKLNNKKKALGVSDG
jgi:PAS domain S-box-containing protein